MRIQHNIMAMNAYRNYNTNTKALAGNLEKLSSGYKINRAGDDAAGLAISEKMRAQITGLDAAQKNVKDGISLVKTAEGAMQEIQDMLNRMDYLATQSANGTYDNEVDRANLQKEVDALKTEINRIADSANFNGIKLLDGSMAAKAATEQTVKATVAAGTVTAGVAGVKAGKIDLTFDETDSPTGLHVTTDSADQKAAKFTVDFSSVKVATAATTGNTTLTVKVGDKSFTVTAANTGSDLAGTAFGGGKTVKISMGGVTFSGTVTNGKVEFTYAGTVMSAAQGKADAINEKIFGAAVSVSVTPAAGKSATLDAHDLHGVQSVTAAVDKAAGKMAGITLELDDKVVADGNTLTIGNKTFVFKTETDSAATTANGEIMIDLSKFDSEDIVKEAARKLSATTVSITNTKNGNTTTFYFSAVDGEDGKIHIDQERKSSNNELYTADDLKALFSAEAQDTAAVKATMKLTATAGTAPEVNAGDQVTIGGKTYTMGEDLTQDDLTTKLAAATKESFEAAVEKVLNSQDFKGKYTHDVGTDGSITITATTGRKSDTAAAMNAIKEAIAKETTVKISTLAESDIGKGGRTLQIGDTAEDFNQMAVKIGDMHVDAMGAGKDAKGEDSDLTIKGIDISTQEGAQEAIATIKNAINYVSGIRGDLGAIQNRLEHTGNNLSVMAENIQDAESTIRDTDVADEMMKYVKNNILVQSAQAMLAQANQVPQGVLQLLG